MRTARLLTVRASVAGPGRGEGLSMSGGMTDRQTPVKTLTSRNFVGGR